MIRLFLAVLLLCSTATNAIAQEVGEGGSGVVRALNGDGLMVPVPKDWVLDNRALARQGIDMLFYPANSIFNGMGSGTPVYAYVMPTFKGAPNVSVKGLIEMRGEQIRRFDKASTTIVEQAATLSENKVSMVTIVHYSIPSFPRFERVAYLEDDRTIYAVILSAISAEELDKQSPLITQIISNHQRMIAK